MIFLDTEFTDLVIHPRLLSVGMVGELDKHNRAPEFYAEVDDLDHINAASWFVRGAVLPQFGQVANAACPYAVLGSRLVTFFDALLATLGPAAQVDVAFGHHLDWDLVDKVATESDAARWDGVKLRLKPVNVYALTGFDAGERASEAYFKTQAQAAYGRHHALCDARALRSAYAAAPQAAPEPLLTAAAAPFHALHRADPPHAATYGLA